MKTPESINRPVFVIVPRLDDSGPVKGAVAFCNGLANHFSVSLVCLKGIQRRPNLHPEVEVVSLHQERSFRGKYRLLKGLLRQHDRTTSVISFCFSADLMNFFLRSRARITSSVRGNLRENYYYTYGLPGLFLAGVHYRLLRRFDRVIVLSEAMKKQAKRYGLTRLSLIGNFIDEPHLENHRLLGEASSSGAEKRIVFIGSLSRRKRPDLLIQAARFLREKGIRFQMNLIGDGPLRPKLEKAAQTADLEGEVHFLGHVRDPYPLIREASLMVLPSESEGIPRSALEALYYGVPCILRDVDANSELIQHGVNGYLFRSDQEFCGLLESALLGAPLKSRECLIPPQFRYEESTRRILDMLGGEQ